MSVRNNHYVLIGVRYDYHSSDFLKLFNFKNESDFDDNFEAVVEPFLDSPSSGISSFGGLSILDDGMNGDYSIVGYILNKSDEYEGDLNDYTQPYKTIKEVKGLFWDQFNTDVNPELIAITHYR